MTLRLVLVSLVAALGLTLPGSPTIERWVASTQNWMYARLADWDTRNPQTTSDVIVSDYYDAQKFAARPAPGAADDADAPESRLGEPWVVVRNTRTDAVRTVSFARTRPSFEPIVPDVAAPLGFAEELNRRNEGIGIAPAPARRPLSGSGLAPILVPAELTAGAALAPGRQGLALAPAAPAAARPAPVKPGFEPIDVADDLDGDFALALNRRSEGIGIRPSAPARPAPAAPTPVAAFTTFGDMENGPNLYFSGPIVADAPRTAPAPAVAAEVRRPEVRPRPARRADDFEDLDVETAGALTPLADGFGTPGPAAPRATATTAALPRFEPLDVPDDLYGGVAFELNRRGEGMQPPAARLASSGRPAASPPAARPELSRAVRLTRDAVYAWVSVFTGPALVTVSPSH